MILALLAATIAWIAWGVTVKGYYLAEIAGQFFALGLVAAVVGLLFRLPGVNGNGLAESFRDGAMQMAPAVIVVAIAKGIVLLLGGDDPTRPSGINTLLDGVGGWAQRNPFMAGIAGGFIGAGIGSLLFGGAGGLSSGGAAGMIGMLLQVLLFGGLAYVAFRLLRRVFAGNTAQPAMTTPEGATFRTTGSPQQDDRYAYQPGQGSGTGGLFGGQPGQGSGTGGLFASAPALQPIAVAETDLDVFSGILLEVQAAWTAGDVTKLRALATPEMVSYFSEALSDNASKGVSNHVENITLLKGDVEQSWTEEGRDYVTASLTWSALDYNVKLDQPSVVIGGDRNTLVESTEMWTFMRSKGGRWLLSAIQQVG